jgi:predicted metal-dependent phosphoesterase TrpH
VIDLHTHTTASDGRCSAADLVARAAAAGVSVLAVTDHDTVAGCAPAAEACASRRLEFVPGIEMTAVMDEADVHVLGYFIDVNSGALHAFLSEQRFRRIDRVRQMVARLRHHGIPLDAEAIVAPAIADPARSAGRPWIARALVAGGYARDSNDAFARWLSRGRPAFVPRAGAAPAAVFDRIHEAGGVASLAHPALIGRDDCLAEFARAGLDAIEAYHSEHSPDDTARYLRVADQLGLAVSGGSDYHGDAHGPASPGAVTLPAEAFERLRARAGG